MENFSKYTTLQIGGPVKQVLLVENSQQLIETLTQLTTSHESFLIIGGGSNLLVSDQGYQGVIIKNEIKGTTKKDNTLIVKSGTVLQDLVDFADNEGLQGLESLAGIPGTVGGAIYGNAGAYGQSISDHLVSVQTINPNNQQLLTLDKNSCEFEYRTSVFKKTKAIILEAVFSLSSGNSEELKTISEETIKKRAVKYPPGIKCPGSFFKNIIASTLSSEQLAKIPQEKIVYGKVPSGALLEMINAKGDRLGNIEIAPYHANLFINLGDGTAEDFYNLAKKYFDKVKEKFGISLEPEVQLINLPPLNQ